MAKKKRTKSQKKIAELKRQLKRVTVVDNKQTETQKESPRESPTPTEPQFTYTKPKKAQKPLHKAEKVTLMYDPKLIRRDLRKTVFLSVLAISLELVLYFSLSFLS